MPATVAVCGGGPTGLFAALTIAERRPDVRVRLFEAKPGFGRKFLVAGRGGLNLTNACDDDALLARFAHDTSDDANDDDRHAPPLDARLREALTRFGPNELRAFATRLGIETFVGPSGRVFPRELRASPMLRAWLTALDAAGVERRPKHRLIAIEPDGTLHFDTPSGRHTERPHATLLALGGASWPRTGSTAQWIPWLRALGAEVTPLRPSNCGFEVDWSTSFAERFAGTPVKNVRVTVADTNDDPPSAASSRGEIVVTRYGLEGGGIYDVSRALRLAIETHGTASLTLDLKPDVDEPELARRLAAARPKESLSTVLRKQARLSPVAIGLLREAARRTDDATTAPASAQPPRDPAALAHAIRHATIELTSPRPIEEAISTAGGVSFASLGEGFRLRAAPSLWIAGEMLDYDAPTGGFLLQACFATAYAAAEQIVDELPFHDPGPSPV